MACRPRKAASDRGYSLVELLLTVVFVMLGSQMIQAGFLRAADVFGRYSGTLKIVVWTEEQAAHAREALLRDQLAGSEAAVLEFDGRPYDWRQETDMEPTPNLYSIRQTVSWSESGRPQTFQKEFYAYRKDASQG